MARFEIIAPGAAQTVGVTALSLWIAPALWKTPRTRFPQGPWTRAERAPTRSTGIHSFNVDKKKKTKTLRP